MLFLVLIMAALLGVVWALAMAAFLERFSRTRLWRILFPLEV